MLPLTTSARKGTKHHHPEITHAHGDVTPLVGVTVAAIPEYREVGMPTAGVHIAACHGCRMSRCRDIPHVMFTSHAGFRNIVVGAFGD